MENQGFGFRLCGTTGCEIIDREGFVIAWTVDAAWASVIVELLNCVEMNGLTAVARFQDGHSPEGQKHLEECNVWHTLKSH